MAARRSACSVIRRNRSSSSWYHQRQWLRGSVIASCKYLCGPFFGKFDDPHADPEDEESERQYELDACKKYPKGSHGKKYLDLPVGSLEGESGYNRKGKNRTSNSPVDAQEEEQEEDIVPAGCQWAACRKIKKNIHNPVDDFMKVVQDHPDIFLNDLWELIEVNVEGEGGRVKKKRKGKLIIDKLSPDGPPGDISKLMGRKVPPDDLDDEHALRIKEKDLLKQKNDLGSPRDGSKHQLERLKEIEAEITKIQEAENYLKLKRAFLGPRKRPQLHTLEIIGCGLLEVPPVLREVPTLRRLKLSHNKIKILTEEWLWPEDERPVVELQYRAMHDHLVGEAAAFVTELYGDGIPGYLCTPQSGGDSTKFELIGVADQPMKWCETKWARKVENDDMVRPEKDFWETIRPQRRGDDEAITDWLVMYPDGDGGRVLTYPMELAGKLVVSEEMDLRETGSVVSGVEYKIVSQEREFPNLEYLFLDWNSIYSIEVQAMSGGVVAKLQVLNLSHNCLNVLPTDFMEGARELRYLDLSGNEKLRTIPDTVMECSKLELLFLTHNSIEQLPPIKKVNDFDRMCKRLKRLRKLFVAYNRLTELPEDIGLCGKLEKIRLSHNCIREFPRSLLKLRHTLQELAFAGNPLQQPLLDGANIETNMHFFEDYWAQRDSAEDPTAGSKDGKDPPTPLPQNDSEPDLPVERSLAQAMDAEMLGQASEVDIIQRDTHVGRFEANPRGPAHRRE